jgi:O-succinylbenzoic acid--CoA ligase
VVDILLDAARDAPRNLAVGSLTYEELNRLVDKTAAALSREKNRIPLGPLPPIEIISHILAAWRLGSSPCPLSARLPPAQMEVCKARILEGNYEGAPSLFLFTSGSTGVPKLAVLSLKSLIANASPILSALNLTSKDTWLLSLPLFHVGGIGILIRCILARARISLDASDPDITHLSSVPTQIYRASPVYKNLRCILLGGAPLPEAFNKRLPIFPTYGLTEMGSLVTLQGKTLANREVKLNKLGEILVKGPCLFQGYWEEGRLHPPGAWFPTKDIGEIVGGKLAIKGRKDWQFISGGENIQPEEIERALLTLPNILEAAVVPLSDPEFGARPVAFVHASDPSLTLESLKPKLLSILPKFKIPIRLYLLDELPKNGLKINRKLLIETANKKLANF